MYTVVETGLGARTVGAAVTNQAVVQVLDFGTPIAGEAPFDAYARRVTPAVSGKAASYASERWAFVKVCPSVTSAAGAIEQHGASRIADAAPE